MMILSFDMGLQAQDTQEMINSDDQTHLWDEAESRKCFQEAKANLEAGDPQKALLNLSEILEFFPDTDVWPLACIEIIKIYRLDKNLHAAQQTLNRLIAVHHSQSNINLDILLAQWEFFIQLGQSDNLISWLSTRSEEEKKSLRLDPRLIAQFTKLLQEKTFSMDILIDIWTKLGNTNPLRALLDLIQRNDGFLLDKKQSSILLNASIESGQLYLIETTSQLMGKNGWAEEAQRQFSNHSKDPNGLKWKSIWLRFLINRQLYRAALDILPEDGDAFALEHTQVLIGLEYWDRAVQIVLKNIEWITSALSYDQLLQLGKGLAGQQQYQLLLEKYLEQLKAPLRKMIQTEMMPRGTNRQEKLLEVFNDNSLHGPRAAMLLGESYQAQRRLEDLVQLRQNLIQRYPSANSVADALQTSIETLQSLQSTDSNKSPTP